MKKPLSITFMLMTAATFAVVYLQIEWFDKAVRESERYFDEHISPQVRGGGNVGSEPEPADEPPQVKSSAKARKSAPTAKRTKPTAAPAKSAASRETAGKPQTPNPAMVAKLPPAPPIKTVKEARALVEEGRIDEAISGLQKLQRRQPQNPAICLLLGNLYFKKMWWSDGMDQYQAAIQRGPAYKKKAIITRNLIAALGSDKTHDKARAVIVKSVGRTALPQLRRAAKHHKNGMTRRRSAALVKQLIAKKRPKTQN